VVHTRNLREAKPSQAKPSQAKPSLITVKGRGRSAAAMIMLDASRVLIAVAASTAALHASGRIGVEHFPESRPVEAEVKAVVEAVDLAAATKAAIYLVHLSSRAALDAMREGKRRAHVFGETRPLYLYLTSAQFDRPDAALWVGQPPLGGEAIARRNRFAQCIDIAPLIGADRRRIENRRLDKGSHWPI